MPVKQHIPEISFDDFYKKVAASGKRLAEEAVFELTYRCNLNCCHCYCNKAGLKRQADELSTDEYKNLIDDAVSEGCMWAAFTGGEPLLREDFFELYLYAKKKGVLCAVMTNAALIDEAAADFFMRWPPKQIEVSLYGATPEVYESVTGVKDSFERCMRGINLLRERNIIVEIKTMVLKQNKHQIKDIANFAEKVGARFRYDTLVHARLDGDKAPHVYRLSAQDIAFFDEELGYVKNEWDKQCALYKDTVVDTESLYTCGAGRTMFRVNPYGLLGTCGFPPKFQYDLRCGTFKEGWHDFIPSVMQRKRQRKDFVCKDCNLHALCPQCANWAYLECGDEEEVVEYLCEFCRKRAEHFGVGALIKKEE